LHQVRIRWLDGEYDGLVQWVPTIRLIAPWGEIPDLLSDEARLLQLRELQSPPLDPVHIRAIQQIYYATDGPVVFDADISKPVHATIDNFHLYANQLPVGPEMLLASAGAYIDSAGSLQVGQEMALKLAKALCLTNGSQILERTMAEIQEARRTVQTGILRREGSPLEYRVTGANAAAFLAECEAVDCLLRSWCGADQTAQVDQANLLRAEIARLRLLVEDTANWSARSGHPVKARIVRQGLLAIPQTPDG
jgi:hypothetical protein